MVTTFSGGFRALLATAATFACTLQLSAQTIPPCNVGGTGGLVPATGSGNGTYQTVLPTSPSIFTITAAVPPGATHVTSVTLRGYTHTWVGDVQFVLQDPAGNRHNLFSRPGATPTTNYSCNATGGDYTIVGQCTGGSLAMPASCTGSTVFPVGQYDQYFGNWAGGLGIANTPLNTIPAAAGSWSLIAYDWASGDSGSLTSWEICFGTPPPPSAPTVAPTLVSPANAASTCDSAVLTWNAAPCATSYDVDIDGTVYGPIAGTTFTTPVLAPGVHTWMVRGTNVSGTGPYSASRTFTSTAVAPAAAPALATPANAAVVSNPVTLSWAAATCATSYDIDIDGTVYTSGTTSFVAPSMAPGTHTWMVRGTNTYGQGPYSASRTFDVLGPPPASVCASNSSAGGIIPASGTGGGGTWPTVLPPTPFTETVAVTTPSGSTKIVKLALRGLNHTWVGDLHVVLTDPSGINHNILYRPGSTANSVGSGCDLLAGQYDIYETYAGAIQTGCTTNIAPGAYEQSFGDWNSGDAGIVNTALESIPVLSGTNNWTLTIYDWVSADVGSLTGWDLCFDVNPVNVLDCQIAPTVSQTCDSVASYVGSPSASAGSGFTNTFSSLNAQANGVVFYGTNGPVSVTWSAQSNLCVKAPTVRLGGVSGASGLTGGTIGNCDGQYSFDMNTVLFNASVPAGTNVAVQAWFRDPAAPKTTQQSDALQFLVGP